MTTKFNLQIIETLARTFNVHVYGGDENDMYLRIKVSLLHRDVSVSEVKMVLNKKFPNLMGVHVVEMPYGKSEASPYESPIVKIQISD